LLGYADHPALSVSHSYYITVKLLHINRICIQSPHWTQEPSQAYRVLDDT
jgi:hypothetical protein